MASKKKVTGGKRPQNLRRTLGQFSAYLGRHRIMIGLVALLAAISALAALFGTYMIRPVVNGLLENGAKPTCRGRGSYRLYLYHWCAVHPGLYPADGARRAKSTAGDPPGSVCPPADQVAAVL